MITPCVHAQDDWNDNSTTAVTTTNDDWNDNAVATTSNDDWNDNAVATTSNDDWNDNAVSTTGNDDWNDNAPATSSSTNSGVRSTSSGGGGISWILIAAIVGGLVWFFGFRKKKKKGAKNSEQPVEEPAVEEPENEEIEFNGTAQDANPETTTDMNNGLVDKLFNNEALSGVMDAFGVDKSMLGGQNKQYFVNVQGKEHGPYTLQQMQGFVQQGRMNAHTLVRTADKTAWAAASSFSEFKSLAQQGAAHSASSADQFMVNVQGKQHGPYTLQQMQGFIQQGRMNRNTQVMIVGKTGWIPAANDNRLLQMLTRAGY